MKFHAVFCRFALVVVMSLSGAAWASGVTVDADESRVAKMSGAPASANDAELTGVASLGVAVSVAVLEEYRGGFDVVKNDMQLSGTVANNSTFNVVSGNNLISEGSFAHSNGFPTVVQNSGSNVLIQNATIINLQYE